MTDATYGQIVGQRIGAARRAAGLTHAQLAERLGWPRDTLIHYEHGRRALSVERLAAIATALAIHPATLLIEDKTAATLIERLIHDTDLCAQVAFFISTLEAD